MKSLYKILIVPLALFASLTFSNLGYGSDDDQAYFLQAALINKVWEPTKAQQKAKRKYTIWNYLIGDTEVWTHKWQTKDNASWLTEYMGRKADDWPAIRHIIKWPSKEITIGFDWPPYGDDCSIRPKQDVCVNPSSLKRNSKDTLKRKLVEKEHVVVEHVKSLTPQLSAMTGRDVKFLDTASERERTKKHAKIRIVFDDNMDQDNFFKKNYLPYMTDVLDAKSTIIDVERLLWGAVPFTPDARSQVEGYIIADEYNDIEFAVCKIFPAVGDALLKALVTECLGRAMGIQNVVDRPDSIFGLWNKHFDRVSKLVAKDGWDKRNITFHHEPFPENIEKESVPPDGFSDFDKELISLLYCNAVKAGMNADEVRGVVRTDACKKP